MMEKLVQGDEAFGSVELIDRVIVDFDNDIGGFSNLENNDDKRKAKKIVSCSMKEGRPGGGVLGSRTRTTISVQKKPRNDQQTTIYLNGDGIKHVRKEKLGGKIMALQQLVSPFGKSDTASVLHEALGYIKFLHDQVQIEDLQSKGLCIVPIEFVAHVMGSNGADLWSPNYGKLQ
ncbi:basic helix-loop-helix (bHLH) DNA-binding superfamily [Zostera marina]|uniref:Basic helix-loop-helix (BHLH) DNA-binding superfamily n=1 Tax=Zostera marina TaxID=29655 RepID=A0A0K9NZN6_ZOSMR|nr:basic helix-loop-helix (bHLH) DNA-binding superfamily [Zostera marina]